MKKLILSLALVSGLIAVKAQFTYDYLKAADNYYRKEDYFSASQYYEKYLEGNKSKKSGGDYNPYTVVQTSSRKTTGPVSTHEQAVYNLAESYRKLNFHIKAEPHYRTALDFDKAQFPLARYRYATTLRALEKYAEAEQAFTQFLAEYTTADQYTADARREVDNLRFIQQQLSRKDLNLFTINKSGGSLNSKGATYAPYWMNSNTLLFTSTRPDSARGEKIYTNRVYQTSFTDGSAGSAIRMDLPQDEDFHQGAVTLTPDGNTIFFTRWSSDPGKKIRAIYSSKRAGSGWSEPAMLEESVNTPLSSSQQPFVTPDGKHLIYSSNRSGGQGGFDLYIAGLDANGNVTGASENLGSVINTQYDEQAPFYHAPSGTLVFSTNGRVGMGGFDFFQSKGTPGNWSDPVNLGYPVNSVKDDIYFTSRGPANNMLQDVMLSSDRTAECCLEMFAMNKVRPLRQISGSVVDCETGAPIQGAVVNILDTVNNRTIGSRTTATDGTYSFTMEDYQPLKLMATTEGYYSNAIHITAPADLEELSMRNPAICLNRIIIEKPIVLENVYYEFDKAELKTESFPSLDNLVTLLNENPTWVIELSAHTDSKGSDRYNMRLSEARARSVVDYLVSKGIDRSRLQPKGYGSSQPVAPNTNPDGSDNPEGRQKNRRTEFKILKQ